MLTDEARHTQPTFKTLLETDSVQELKNIHCVSGKVAREKQNEEECREEKRERGNEGEQERGRENQGEEGREGGRTRGEKEGGRENQGEEGGRERKIEQQRRDVKD